MLGKSNELPLAIATGAGVSLADAAAFGFWLHCAPIPLQRVIKSCVAPHSLVCRGVHSVQAEQQHYWLPRRNRIDGDALANMADATKATDYWEHSQVTNLVKPVMEG